MNASLNPPATAPQAAPASAGRLPDPRRVLLVHPLGYRAGAAASDIARRANIMPPVGLASLAAWLERRGFETDIVDCNAHPAAAGRIRELLLARRPATLGLSCTTAGFLDGVRIAALAKATLPGIRTVVGGPHASALAARALEGFDAIDFAVVGEGEETLAELAAGLDDSIHRVTSSYQSRPRCGDGACHALEPARSGSPQHYSTAPPLCQCGLSAEGAYFPALVTDVVGAGDGGELVRIQAHARV